jgi:hypothetical protein
MTWPSVHDAFRDFTARIEGILAFLYLDVKCLVTVAIGNLVDPIGAALSLPFVRPDGTPASRVEIAAAWHAVKARTDLARMGGAAFASVTTIRLTPDGINAMVWQRMASNESFLVKRFPAFDTWPADAQLALHSIAWAAGPGWAAPHFDAAARALDFATCAGPAGDANADPSKRGEAWLENNGKPGPNPANPGLHRRNLCNKDLLQAAADTIRLGRDPALLWSETVS